MTWEDILKNNFDGRYVSHVLRKLKRLQNIHEMIEAVEDLDVKSKGGWRLEVLIQERDAEPYTTGFKTRGELLSHLKHIKAEMAGMVYELAVEPIGDEFEEDNSYLFS